MKAKERYKPDKVTFFSEDHKSGIIELYRQSRAIYFVDNIDIDIFIIEENVSTDDLNRWAKEKKKHYDNLKTK